MVVHCLVTAKDRVRFPHRLQMNTWLSGLKRWIANPHFTGSNPVMFTKNCEVTGVWFQLGFISRKDVGSNPILATQSCLITTKKMIV